ncbi:uncharacterized protein BT62DRAFT_963326 [Guyanagaster necrorhizus]|uniref:BTB domain-containing protein n=1 Tax=Guyanagaster necrorhizus TaxID=856835 RepID=A0A9P8AVQ7_9AGAR|nr:uncharacterized protein BT62DRAFT_963326 [Guyanagaster necrorhizus MCA 3950]KAG7449824.1 hypothetical protein BT62DRAFT_963326 [Guyanagaster necrorhizus MCA 3950]
MASKSSHPRSSEFYWQSVIFLVGGQLYQVPRHHFEKSSDIFASMFSLPPDTESAVADGSDDDHPIELQGVESKDFECLLKVLFTDARVESTPLLPEEWLLVLRLANMWVMSKVRQIAIYELKKLSLTDVARVVYGREFAVSEWVISGYRDLVDRRNAVSEAEAQQLGLTTTLQLWQVQMKLVTRMPMGAMGSAYGYRPPPTPRDVFLNEVFEAEIEDINRRAEAFGDDLPIPNLLS